MTPKEYIGIVWFGRSSFARELQWTLAYHSLPVPTSRSLVIGSKDQNWVELRDHREAEHGKQRMLGTKSNALTSNTVYIHEENMIPCLST